MLLQDESIAEEQKARTEEIDQLKQMITLQENKFSVEILSLKTAFQKTTTELEGQIQILKKEQNIVQEQPKPPFAEMVQSFPFQQKQLVEVPVTKEEEREDERNKSTTDF